MGFVICKSVPNIFVKSVNRIRKEGTLRCEVEINGLTMWLEIGTD